MTEIYPDLSKVIEGVVSNIIPEDTVDRIAGESIEIIIIEIVVIAEAGIGLERDYFQEILVVIELEVQATVNQGQGLEPVPIGTG